MSSEKSKAKSGKARRPTKIQLDALERKYQLGDFLASGGCGTVMDFP